MGFFASKSVPCPYCYNPIQMSKVAFRCNGQAQAGRPACQPVEDPNRLQFFSDGAPVMPIITRNGVEVLGKGGATCEQCGSRSAVRCCPHCHSLLPHGLDDDSPLFALVGVRASGKTVMLSVLHNELTRTVARRFNASIDTPGGGTGLAATLKRNDEEMTRQGGVLPAQTAAGAKSAPAVYEWRYELKGKLKATIFSFYDNAGEDFASQDRALSIHYLNQASGVILLLDPFSFPANLERAQSKGVTVSHTDGPEQVLDAITYVLQVAHDVKQGKRIKVPIAVVVSKIDAFFDTEIGESHPLRQPASTLPVFNEMESASLHEHMAMLIDQWGGDGLLRKLEQNYTTFRIFGATALGAEPDYRSGRVNDRGRLPHRVADPLLWLMAQRKFIAVQEK